MPSRYRFHGSAFGAAGQVTRPFHEVIEVQAPSTLPQIGGHGTGHSVDFRHRHILRFDLAHTQVTGGQYRKEGETEDTYSTRVSSVVEGLNIADVITADRVVAMLVSTYGPKSNGEPTVKLVGTHFDNLRIAGIPIHVDLAIDIFDYHHTHSLLAAAYQSNESAIVDKSAAREKGGIRGFIDRLTLADHPKRNEPHYRRWVSDHLTKDGGLPHSKGITHLSLVRGIQPDPCPLDYCGHMFHVDGFGTIRLAELEIHGTTRNLTMIRITMGSPCGADIEVAGAWDGGSDN